MIWVDITSFYLRPQNTGIQRVILNLTQDWQNSKVNFELISTHESNYIIKLNKIKTVQFMKDMFNSSLSNNNQELNTESLVDYRFLISDFLTIAKLYFLPEVNLNLNTHKLIAKLGNENIQTIALCFDIHPVLYPEFYPLMGNAFYEYLQAIEKSKKIAISKNTSKFLKSYFNSDEKITIAYPGTDHKMDSANTKVSYLKRSIDILLIGTIEEKKKQIGLLKKLHEKDEQFLNRKIVLMGQIGQLNSENLDFFDFLLQNYNILHVNDYTDSQAGFFLRNSKLSFSLGHEGWGITTLEAMIHGMRIITDTNQPSITELGLTSPISLDLDSLTTSYIDNILFTDFVAETTDLEKISKVTWAKFSNKVLESCYGG